MADTQISVLQQGFGRTRRRDMWWAQPLAVFIGLSAFIAYSTWAAFQGQNYHWGPYLSPFYSPELFGDSPHAADRGFGGCRTKVGGGIITAGRSALRCYIDDGVVRSYYDRCRGVDRRLEGSGT